MKDSETVDEPIDLLALPCARRRQRVAWSGVARGRRGFTLLELMFAVAVISILTMLAVAQFSRYIDRAHNATAQSDIAMMQVDIERYRTGHAGALPGSLSDIGRSAFLDPWQQPYVYTKLAGVNGHGSARKDHRLNPINSDYDLFSAGKNGVFKPQISQKDSLDDIIRARDGGFIGLAEEF